MARRLQREFGRFDVDFLDSDEYIAMPEGIRVHAYLYLLALSGRSRKRRSDGLLTLGMAQDMARKIRKPALALLGALEAVGMVSLVGELVTVTKYSKWQETKAEIEEAQADARERKARSRASHNDVTTMSHDSHATEKEREKEREVFNAPPNPLGGLNAGKDDPALELGVAMHELLGRQISTVDLIACQAAINQYAYLTVKDLVIRAHDHVDYCRDHTLPAPRSVDGFSDSWRRENDYRSDKGLPKAERVVIARGGGMTKAFEMAS